MMCVIMPVLFILSFENVMSSSFCYWNSGCPYKYFSSKTPYSSIRGDIRDSVIRIKGCEPISIWGLLRHGKRQPGIDFSNKMKTALAIQKYVVKSFKAGKCSLCAQDVEDLGNWQNDTRIFEDVHRLTDEGFNEMKNIGKRLRQAFPNLLANLTEGTYMFQPVFGHWIEESAAGFVKGFNDENLTYYKPETENEVAAPYSTCNIYQKEIKNNSITYLEAKKYLDNPEYLAAKDRIQRRSGIDYVLSDDNITALYDLCRYNSSGYHKKLSPWCALFTTEDLKVLEYIGDLRHYYRNGYGNPFTKIFGRIPLADLLKNFRDSKDGIGKKLIAFISHSTMLDMVYTALGLFKDAAPLTSAHRNPNRKWRSTKMSTFSANLIAVLHRCTKEETTHYNVVFYLNEEPLMSLCKEGVCSWKEFEEKLTFAKTDLDFCDGESDPYKIIFPTCR